MRWIGHAFFIPRPAPLVSKYNDASYRPYDQGNRSRVFPVIWWGAFLDLAGGDPADHDAEPIASAFM